MQKPVAPVEAHRNRCRRWLRGCQQDGGRRLRVDSVQEPLLTSDNSRAQGQERSGGVEFQLGGAIPCRAPSKMSRLDSPASAGALSSW